jgi:hypothetical protein
MYSFGETAPWGESVWDVRVVASPREVYLWRAKMSGVVPKTPYEALKIVQAIGRKLSTFDIRGITLSDVGGSLSVDVVYTAADYVFNQAVGGWDSAEQIAGFVFNDSELRGYFPSMSIVSSSLAQLTGPPSSVDFWLNRSILWNHSIGPMQAFSNVENVYKGVADDGLNLNPWKQDGGLAPPPDPGHQVPEEKSGLTGLWILAAVVGVAWLGSRLLQQGKGVS